MWAVSGGVCTSGGRAPLIAIKVTIGIIILLWHQTFFLVHLTLWMPCVMRVVVVLALHEPLKWCIVKDVVLLGTTYVAQRKAAKKSTLHWQVSG